jgi:benzoate/toluate 1,2-dioxygenase beta subunit
MSVTRSEIENFLYREARLLDTQQFEEWLELFTDDAVYWVPAGRDNIDPKKHISIIYDDKAAMRTRVKRLRSGLAYAQDPASKVNRLISNVELLSFDESSKTQNVTCMMLLVELARHRQTMHTARCEFALVSNEGSWRVRSKKVNLLKNNEILENTPFLI